MATLPAALAKRIGPVDASPIMSAGAAGTLVHPRVDEVLLYLTNYGAPTADEAARIAELTGVRFEREAA